MILQGLNLEFPIDIEYNKRLDRRQPYFEDKLTGEAVINYSTK